MKGSMTQGTEWRHILLFALPLMVGQFLQQLYNTVDGIVVGNFVGDIALGAVGTCSPVTLVFVSLAVGMCTGCSVVVSQYFGAKKMEEMRRAASTSIILLLMVGAVLSVLGVAFARPLLRNVLGVGDWYIDDATVYLAIYAAGLLFQFAYNAFAALLRAVGDSKASLYFLLISSIVNLVLDLVFVIVFHWGVAGAAIATTISQIVSAAVAGVYMVRKYEVFRFGKGEFRFHKASAKLILRLAVPSTLTQVVMSGGNLVLQRVVNDFGAIYPGLMGGTTAAMRVEHFVYVPIFGFSTAMSTFTGQNMGAGHLDRVMRGRKACLLMSLAVSVTVAAIVLLLREPLVSLFGVSAEGLQYGSLYLIIFCPSLLLFCFYMIHSGVLQGAGDTSYTAFILATSYALRIIVAYCLAYLTPLEYRAVWISIPIGWVCNVTMSWLRYRSGAWKTKGVAHVKT